MTLKNINKSGQAIFEYFILTAVVLAVVLFLASSQHFRNIKTTCEGAFNQAVNEILQ